MMLLAFLRTFGSKLFVLGLKDYTKKIQRELIHHSCFALRVGIIFEKEE